MGLQERYEIRKEELLKDNSICQENRYLFNDFFEYEERKLKRQNGLSSLDLSTYKTLLKYIIMFRNVNNWFNNKPWSKITKEDIQRVYDDLEDGKIKKHNGTPFKDRSSYYNKVLKSKPFRLAGKAELAKDVIEYYVSDDNLVRFVSEDTFRKMVSVIANPRHLLLFWLQWDIGENIGALLQLTKGNFKRQINPQTQESEYLVHLPHKILKRSRQWRSEPTLYPETAKYLDMILPDLQEDELVFRFGHRQALKLIKIVVNKVKAKCESTQKEPTWKDLRSGMACHLLHCGWSREEIDARLEEIIAEMGAISLCNEASISIPESVFDDSLNYIEHWANNFKNPYRMMGRIFRQTSQAVDYILNRIPGKPF